MFQFFYHRVQLPWSLLLKKNNFTSHWRCWNGGRILEFVTGQGRMGFTGRARQWNAAVARIIGVLAFCLSWSIKIQLWPPWTFATGKPTFLYDGCCTCCVSFGMEQHGTSQAHTHWSTQRIHAPAFWFLFDGGHLNVPITHNLFVLVPNLLQRYFNGGTALHCAARYGLSHTVAYLLSRGSDGSARYVV